MKYDPKRMSRLRPVLACLLAGFALPAWAGLGPLHILSAPGEAFFAEIPVEPEPGLSAPNAVLAPLERYASLGPYSGIASQLSIKTREVAPGSYMIAINGPVLGGDENVHFALELSWASGRVVREYLVPAGGGSPRTPDKKPSSQAALPAERQTFITGGDGLGLGDGRLLSVRGLPLRAEFELLGDWPSSADMPRQFALTRVQGLAAGETHSFSIRQRQGRMWLRVHGNQPVNAAQIEFTLQAQLGSTSILRHFSFAVPRAGRRLQKHVPPADLALAPHGYQVKSGDTLSRLARRYAATAPQPWMDEVFARNPHAFAGHDRNVMYAGTWLVLPGARAAAAAPAAEPDSVKALPATPPPVKPPVVAPAKPAAAVASQPAAVSHAASAPSDMLISQRLKEAQQRMQWLEAEINRLASQPENVGLSPQPPALAPLTEQESSFLDGHLTNWVLTGVGGVSVASLLAWMLMRRRRQKVSGLPFVTVMPTAAQTVSVGLPPEARPLSQPVAADINVDAVDVFAEADVLMAYGRFDAAETLLRDALRAEPEREDLRMKLLDLVSRKGNKGEFEEMALDVLAIFGPLSTLWGRVQQLGVALDPDNALYRTVERPMGDPFVLDTTLPETVIDIDDAQPLDDAPLPDGVRKAAEFAANDPQQVSVAQALPQDAAVEELARLYREMGDSETADTLLRDAGLLAPASETVDAS